MTISRLNINKLLTFLCFLILSLKVGFFSVAAQDYSVVPDSVSKVNLLADSIVKINPDSLLYFARLHLGIPYKLFGKNSKGFDCSGFVHYIYKKFDIHIPYSCPGISAYCSKKIKKTDVQKGDLLFFKGSNIKSKAIGHVAIVYSVEDGKIKMIHSCRRGVILETLNESPYYKARYLFAKRIL